MHGNLRDNLVALWSAEAELIASVWGNRLALSLYGQLKEMILSKPPHITYCDNSAVGQLTQQLEQPVKLGPDIFLCEHNGYII